MRVRTRNAKSDPAPLHTPSDLKPNGVRDLSGALNILLADMFALYLKTNNFHWHNVVSAFLATIISCWTSKATRSSPLRTL